MNTKLNDELSLEGTREDIEQIGPKEIETEEEIKEKEIEEKAEDSKKLQKRTADLFEVINMCPDDAQICRNEIIELNIRLVPHVLRKYKPFGDDEFQMGCLGLIIATNSFDPDRGVPFSSYACFCIERELHKAHKREMHSIEGALGNSLDYLDESVTFANGDTGNKYDMIPDEVSEQEIEKVLDDFNLSDLFSKVVEPSIDKIGKSTKGQKATIDFDLWKKLEIRYIIEMANVDSQKARLTLTNIAKTLGVSTQNIRIHHLRVIKVMKEKCIELGLWD